MLGVDVCAYGFGGLGTGICALLTQIMYGALELVCKLIGTFVDLLNIAFYIFAGVDFDDGRFNIIVDSTQEKMNILDYFIFNESVTKAYLYLALIALVLVAIFTIYKIIKQDYFDKAGPRSKGPIFRNVAISCISFILVIPIFYLIIHASSLLAVQVSEAMGMDLDRYAGMAVFELSWSDQGYAMHTINNKLAGASVDAGSVWYLENNLLFVLLADGELVKYDLEVLSTLSVPSVGTLNWHGPLAYYGEKINVPGVGEVTNQMFYANFYWYIYFVGIIVALKAMWNLVLAMIQRIFKLLGLFLVAPAPISQYVLDDGAKFKEWLKKSIEEGLRLVVACMSFAIFLLVLGVIPDIDFSSAFKTSMQAAGEGRLENVNVSASTLSYAGEFTNVPTLSQVNLLGSNGERQLTDWEGVVDSWNHFKGSVTGLVTGDWDACANKIIVDGQAKCAQTFFERLINAFMQILLVVAAGGAIKDLDSVLSPLISGAQNSLDAGNTGGAVNAVGKAAMAVAGAAIGGVAGGAISALKHKDDVKESAYQGAKDGTKAEKDDATASKPQEGAQQGAGPASSPTEGGDDTSSPTEGGDDADTNAPTEGQTEEPNTEGENADTEGTETPDTENPENGNGEGENTEGENTEGENKEGENKEGGETEGGNADTATDAATDDKGPNKWKALYGDKEALKAVGKSIGDSKVGQAFKKAGGAISGAVKAVGGAAKKAAGAVGGAAKKVAGGFNNLAKKNLIVGALKKTGKLAFRAAKGAAKVGFTAGKAALSGVKRGALAGLKTAGGAIATAVVGEGTVKSFMGAKKESGEAEEKAIKNKSAKAYSKAKDQAFMSAREQRIADEATSKADEAKNQYDAIVGQESQVVGAENEAATKLDEAETRCATAERAAEGANASILAKDKPLNDAQTQINEHEALIATARSDNATILKEAGVDSYDELDGKIALLDKGSPERTKLEGLRKKYVHEDTIQQWQTKADDARKVANQRATIIDTLSGRNGVFAAAGVTSEDSFAAAKTKVAGQVGAAKETISRLEGKKPSELSKQEKQELEHARQVTQAHAALEQCGSKEEEYYGRETVAAARTQNAAAHAARQDRDDALDTYNEAHAATQAVAKKKADIVTKYNNATRLAQAYAGSAGVQAHTAQGETRGINADTGEYNKNNAKATRKVNKRRTAAREQLEAAAGQASRHGALNAQIVGDVSTPMGAAEVYKASVSHAISTYDQAAETFGGTHTTSGGATINVSEVLQSHGCAYKSKPGQQTQYNVSAVKKLLGSDKIDQPTKEVIQTRLADYEQAQDTYRAQNRVIAQTSSNARATRTVEQRIATNNARVETIATENKAIQQVIASGGQTKLTPQVVQMLNSVPGAHITASSSPQEILAAAKTARHQRTVEQATLTKENSDLQAQADQLTASLRNMISGLANEINGMAAGHAPGTNNTAQAPGVTNGIPGQNVTNITNNVSSEGNGVINAGITAAASVTSQDRMTEAMYERTQTDMLRSNKEMLERVREQNRDILDTVEDIEKEVMNG